MLAWQLVMEKWRLALARLRRASRTQGGVLAPTPPRPREVAEPDGTRYTVLDFIVEVPVTAPPSNTQIRRVPGSDWGVRTLVTATVVGLEGARIPPFLFLGVKLPAGYNRLQRASVISNGSTREVDSTEAGRYSIRKC